METAVRPYPQTITLPHVSWKTYESLLANYAGFSGARLTYDRGTLEIMCPGPDHEETNRTIATLTETIAVKTENPSDSPTSTANP